MGVNDKKIRSARSACLDRFDWRSSAHNSAWAGVITLHCCYELALQVDICSIKSVTKVHFSASQVTLHQLSPLISFYAMLLTSKPTIYTVHRPDVMIQLGT